MTTQIDGIEVNGVFLASGILFETLRATVRKNRPKS